MGRKIFSYEIGKFEIGYMSPLYRHPTIGCMWNPVLLSGIYNKYNVSIKILGLFFQYKLSEAEL
jgi:hypothetical protein